MAKSKAPPKPKAKPKEPTEIEVRYDLFDLPTAFHKAGLAGLALLIDSLKDRKLLDAEDVKCDLTATSLRVTFSEPLLKVLMNDLYDAAIVEAKVKVKWQNATIKREEEATEVKDGKPTRVRYFVYDQIQPKGAFFANVFDGDKAPWLKLWRDMLWSIPRGRPLTRIPFNNMAEGKKSSGEGEAAWADLLKVEKARAKSDFYTAELSSALFPGAQAVNAEGVSFEGRAEQNLLLHFWTLTALLHVPQAVESDGSAEFVGYTLAVPEVSDLAEFVDAYPKLLHGLRSEVRGFRPAGAVIDLAAEGALALMEQLATITAADVERSTLRMCIKAVEYLHLVKEGNNIKTMAAGRVSPRPRLLKQYRELVSPAANMPRYRHPLFRRGLLLALLEDRGWHQPFGKILSTFDADLFIRQPRRNAEAEQKGPPQFANDAAKKFQDLTRLFLDTLNRRKDMPEAERPTAPLSVIVNRVVRNYVLARTAEKSKVKLEDFENEDKIDWKKVPAEFNEAKQKLALGLMLEFRSRKDQAFVDHFAATFFSVTQRIAEGDRLVLANALVGGQQQDDLKTLTLLSLSANS